MNEEGNGDDKNNTAELSSNNQKKEEYQNRMSEAFVVTESSEFLLREAENSQEADEIALPPQTAATETTSSPPSAASGEDNGTSRNGDKHSPSSALEDSNEEDAAPSPSQTLLTTSSSTVSASTTPTTTTLGSTGSGTMTRPGAVAVAAPRPTATVLKSRQMAPSTVPVNDGATPGNNEDEIMPPSPPQPGAVAVAAPPPLVKGNRAMLTTDEMAPPGRRRNRNETTNTSSLLDDDDDEDNEEQIAQQQHANVMKPMDSNVPRAQHPGAVSVAMGEREGQVETTPSSPSSRPGAVAVADPPIPNKSGVQDAASAVVGNYDHTSTVNKNDMQNDGEDNAASLPLQPGAVTMTPASPEHATLMMREESKKEEQQLSRSGGVINSRDSGAAAISTASLEASDSIAMVLGNYDASAQAVVQERVNAGASTSNSNSNNGRSSTSSTSVVRRPPRNDDDYVDDFAAEISSEFFLPRSATRSASEARDSEIKAAAAAVGSGTATSVSSTRNNNDAPGESHELTMRGSGRQQRASDGRRHQLTRTRTPPPNQNQVVARQLSSNRPSTSSDVHVIVQEQDDEEEQRTVSFSGTHGDIPRMISATYTTDDFSGVVGGINDDDSEIGSGPLTVAGESVGATTITQAWGVEEDQKRLEELEKQAVELKQERDNAPRAEIVRVESSRKRESIINITVSRWKTRFTVLLVIVLLLIIAAVTAITIVLTGNKDSEELTLSNMGESPSSANDTNATIMLIPTLEAIRERGYINCRGVPLEMETGVGFSVDMCAAMSAAIFQGNTSKFKMIKMPFREQFASIANGTVDLSTEETTHSMQRDIREPISQNGFTFSNAFFFSGTMFAGIPDFVDCADRGNTLVGICRDLSVCVLEGSVTENIVQNHLGGSVTHAVTFSGDMFARLSDGTCNVITSVPLIIHEQRAREANYTGPYVFGTRFFSRDPLSLTTRNDDPQFGDLVNWVLRALVVAETLNITQTTADQFPTTDLFGEENSKMFQHAIAAVGNYGELYERYYEQKVPRGEAGMNTPHLRPEDGGLLYPSPLGNIGVGSVGDDEVPPAPIPNGTMDIINQRQQLLCGIVVGRPGLAEWNSTMGAWSGIDVDYCKGLASAVFGGGEVEDALVLVEFDLLEDGFVALANKELDVMAGALHNIVNDVREPTTGEGFNFGYIYYYNLCEGDDEPDGAVCALALATRQEDVQWSDFVRLISLSTVHAEANGITQQTAIDMPTLELFGPLYRQAMRDVVLWIGNSADIYERNMERYIPRADNARNTLHQGGTPLFFANWQF